MVLFKEVEIVLELSSWQQMFIAIQFKHGFSLIFSKCSPETEK